jgi:hypothetical protein
VILIGLRAGQPARNPNWDCNRTEDPRLYVSNSSLARKAGGCVTAPGASCPEVIFCGACEAAKAPEVSEITTATTATNRATAAR